MIHVLKHFHQTNLKEYNMKRLGDTWTADSTNSYKVEKLTILNFLIAAIVGVVLPITFYFLYKIFKTWHELKTVKIKTNDFKVVRAYTSDKRFKEGVRKDGTKYEIIGSGQRDFTDEEISILKSNIVKRLIAMAISIGLMIFLYNLNLDK